MLFWIILFLIHFASLLFFTLSLWQLWKYIRVYRFSPGQYQLLMGFIHLRWICIFYGTIVVGLIFSSILILYNHW